MITRDLAAHDGVPTDVLESLKRYVFDRLRPGQFLTGVLSNDLRTAVGHASEEHFADLRRIVQFVYFELPSDCWGSSHKVNAWLKGV